MQDEEKRAVVLLSGGLDSATVLAFARRQGFMCYTMALDYGQRHRAELQAAAQISQALGAVKHHLQHLDLRALGGSALTDDRVRVPVDGLQDGIPVTYVPARNTILLSLALGWAETLNARDIFIGVNAVDYSGYPDCRPVFVDAFERLANLGTKLGIEGEKLSIHAPLLMHSKAEIVALGLSLQLDYSMTVSCYRADDSGRACGVCDACRLRRKGFLDAQVADPTRYCHGVLPLV